MLPIVKDYLSLLRALHDQLERTIKELPVAALDWSPGPDVNSLSVLIVHTAGAERYWIGDVVGRDPSGRDRDAEFRTRGLDAATLSARLGAALEYSRAVLEQLTPPDLEAQRVMPRDESQVTVAWALGHALEHAALHLGHAQIVRQLWDQRQSS
jgi:uncharacterized damage-inducible protein DinB